MDVASRPTIPDQDEDGAVGDEDVLVASRVAATEVAAELAATLEAVQLGEAEELGSNDAKTWRQTLAQETLGKVPSVHGTKTLPVAFWFIVA